MAKLTAEQLKVIKAAMLNKNFKYKQINGIHNFINGAIMEGIEVKTDCSINPYWTDIDTKRYGYDAVGNETRTAVSILEQIFMEQVPEPAAEEQDAPKQEIESKEAELIPVDDKQLFGIVPEYLTQAIIDKHLGTTASLISMQVTNPLAIKTREKGLKYVETAYMNMALNLACLMDWSFEVLETRTDKIMEYNSTKKKEVPKMHVSVLGCVTMHTTDGKTIQKQQWGSQVLKAKMEVGDALKAAASDSMKKCASMFGIAADVYGGNV